MEFCQLLFLMKMLHETYFKVPNPVFKWKTDVKSAKGGYSGREKRDNNETKASKLNSQASLNFQWVFVKKNKGIGNNFSQPSSFLDDR